MTIEDMIGQLTRALATNATDTSFAAIIPTITEPSGDGVFSVPGSSTAPGTLYIYPFGAGSDNQTFDLRVSGWRYAVSSGGGKLWLPVTLCEMSCTLSTLVGIADAAAVATDRFADTITVNKGIGAVWTATANATPAMVAVPLCGCSKFKFSVDMTGATNGNAFFAYGS
jgi:hypothetical protein